jgi:hypothetical protein
MSDQLLETLQADVVGMLQNTPSLALANTLLNDAETTDSKVENAIKTLSGPGGKRGLALVVLRAEIIEGEKNLPGPPLTLRIEIQCVEQPLLNRGADGTGIRSSQAALRVLSVLQLTRLGGLLLYADKDPIKAVQVKPGYVSDAVTLYAKFGGFVTPRPLAVQAEMVSYPTIVVSGTSGANGTLPISDPNATGQQSIWNSGGPSPAVEVFYSALGKWKVVSATYLAEKTSAALTPVGLTGWTVITGSGQPNVSTGAPASLLQLTCDTPASTIRYTTDGSFPSPAKTLYTGPITGLSGGMLIRAAAYVTGLPPSDVINVPLTE